MFMKIDDRSITPEDFMAFFRDDAMLNQLTADDRFEIFSQIMQGSSDFSKDMLDEVLSSYNVCNVGVINFG